MKKKLYRCEAGVLLDKDHPEFESYSNVYTKEFGFYDEEVMVFLSYKNAKKIGNAYIEEGIDRTYCVITSETFNLTEDDIDEVKLYRHLEGINEFGFSENDMIYFAYKDGNSVKVVIDKGE